MNRLSRQLWLAVLVVALLAFVGWRLWHTADRVAQRQAVDQRELALRILGQTVAKEAPGEPVLIIANPFTRRPGQAAAVYTFQTAAERGIRAALGKSARVAVAYPELSAAALADPGSVPLPPDATTPLSFLTAEKAWDALAKTQAQATVWISLIGLPVDLANLEVWRQPKPRFAFLLPDLRLLGEREAIGAAFTSGKILAAVLNRPGAPPAGSIAIGDERSEFDRRFVLVTPENVEAALQAFPELF